MHDGGGGDCWGCLTCRSMLCIACTAPTKHLKAFSQLGTSSVLNEGPPATIMSPKTDEADKVSAAASPSAPAFPPVVALFFPQWVAIMHWELPISPAPLLVEPWPRSDSKGTSWPPVPSKTRNRPTRLPPETPQTNSCGRGGRPQRTGC